MYWQERVRLKEEQTKLNQLLEHLFTCVHESMVVIGDCESIYPVASLIGCQSDSKALLVYLYIYCHIFLILEITKHHKFCMYITSTEHAVHAYCTLLT